MNIKKRYIIRKFCFMNNVTTVAQDRGQESLRPSSNLAQISY